MSKAVKSVGKVFKKVAKVFVPLASKTGQIGRAHV